MRRGLQGNGGALPEVAAFLLSLAATPPSLQAAVSKMLEQLLQYSEAQMKDRSSGIVLFQVANDRYQEATFHTWERYESTAAFSRHTTSPDVMRFLEGVRGAAAGQRSAARRRRAQHMGAQPPAALTGRGPARAHAACAARLPRAQVQQHLEGPVGVALYEWNNGQLGPVGLNEGACATGSTTTTQRPAGSCPNTAHRPACCKHPTRVLAAAPAAHRPQGGGRPGRCNGCQRGSGRCFHEADQRVL